MTRKNLTKPTALLLAATLVTSCFVGGTFARYITTTSSEDSARVAVWGINADGVDMELFASEYDVNGNKVAKSWDGDKIIAPGTSMASKFSIVNLDDTLAPEVMYEIRIDVDDTEIDQRILDNPSIQWKLDDNEFGTWEETKADILALSGDHSGVKTYAPNTVATEFANGKEHTIAWQWMLDDNNVQDTAMGNDAVDEDIMAKIHVKVTARQVQEDTTGLLNDDNQIFNLAEPTTLTFKSAAPLNEFQSVKVDGAEITDTNYTKTEDSTIITLNEDYLSTLEVGTHTLEIISTNITVQTTFKVVNISPLDSRKIMLIGTSISTGDKGSAIVSDTTYIKSIATNNNMLLENKAVAGFTAPQLLSVYINNKESLESYSNNDFVVFEGLLNDVRKATTLGTITPNNTTTFDGTTMIGALESIFYEYTNSNCKAKIGFILTHFPTTTKEDTTLLSKYNTYWDAAITVFEKYNIPYLDLRNKEFSMADTLHPDTAGQLLMSEYVEPWLKTL